MRIISAPLVLIAAPRCLIRLHCSSHACPTSQARPPSPVRDDDDDADSDDETYTYRDPRDDMSPETRRINDEKERQGLWEMQQVD